MRALNDCCSCALAPAAKAIDATASVTNVFTGSSSSDCPTFRCHMGANGTIAEPRRPRHGAVTRTWRSAPGAEEVREQRRRLGLADAAVDLRPVLAGRGGEVAHAALH